MVRKFISIIVFVLCFFLFSTSADASTSFTTDYTVTYTVNDNGITKAHLRGTLTNTTSQYYASSYKMQLGFNDISNVKASDPDGNVPTTVTKNDDGYLLGLTFNRKSVGMGSKLPFTITFDTPTVAKKFGKVWEINIPGIANPSEFHSFTVTVVAPASFGQPAYIKPAQPTKGLTFTKEQLGTSGISIAFGKEQLYSFHLTYHLDNSNIYPIKTEIALPPSTNYQEVYINDINPKPLNVIEDKDGNWLAQYRLLPSQKVDVAVAGVVQMSLTPKQQPITDDEIKLYTKDLPHWQTKDPAIKALAEELKTPQAIYDYVVKTLNYDFSRVTDDKPRLGAAESLKNPTSAVCREFTDLFIAIARAAGIPAREIDGFANTENARQRPVALVKDILHAWPEYYDKEKGTWVMVDPTWGSTTGGIDYFHVLDFDHFAFAIKGTESDYPIPAGGYKLLDSKNVKDIRVNLTEYLPATKADASISSSFPDISIAGLPVKGKLTLKNTGTQELTPQILTLVSQTLTPENQIVPSNSIPPFGSQTWDIQFNPTSFLTKTDAGFTIHFAPESILGDKTAQQAIKIAPFFMTAWGIGTIAGVLLLGGIITFILVRFRKKQ